MGLVFYTSFPFPRIGTASNLRCQREPREEGAKDPVYSHFGKDTVRFCFFKQKAAIYICWTLHTLSLTILSSYTVHLTFSPRRYHAWREACCWRHLGSRSLTSAVRTERWISGAWKPLSPQFLRGTLLTMWMSSLWENYVLGPTTTP